MATPTIIDSTSMFCGFVSDTQTPLERWKYYIQQGLFANELHPPLYDGLMVPLVLVLSVIGHSLLYAYGSDWFCTRYISSFKKKIFNSDNERRDWNSRFVSNIHAVLSSLIALYCLFTVYWPTSSNNGILSKSTSSCLFLLAYSTGYFIYDLFIVASNYPHLGGMETIIHHTVSLVALIGSAVWEKCVVLLVVMMLTEISTPFVNQRYFLSKCGMKSSKMYTYNGLLMWLSFGIVRMSSVFYLPYLMFSDSQTWCSFPFGWIIGVSIMVFSISALNIYWFYKITSGLIQVVMGTAPSKNAPSTSTSVPEKTADQDKLTIEVNMSDDEELDDQTVTTLPLISRSKKE